MGAYLNPGYRGFLESLNSKMDALFRNFDLEETYFDRRFQKASGDAAAAGRRACAVGIERTQTGNRRPEA